MNQLILVYSMFFLGYFLHMGLQIDAAVRAKNNSACSRWMMVKQNAFVLAARLFISFLVFWFMRNNPTSMGTLLSYIGITISPGIGVALNSASWGVAGMFGYMVDSILTFIPFLKNYVPSLNEVQAKVSVTTVEQPGQPSKTTTKIETTTNIPTKDDDTK